jgi:uncharacterized membrane protein YgdD (TMEM256/DUF423 family)
MLSVSIALDAMGAHGLEGAISTKYLGIWNTASLYFALNAVALIGIHGAAERMNGVHLKLIVLGSWIFSISLWIVSLNEILTPLLKKLGLVTPIGGVLMIVGWALIGRNQLRKSQ